MHSANASAPVNRLNRGEKILVIRHGAFGDLVQCNGALADIRAYYRSARIVLLTEPAFRSLMSRCPYVDEIISDARLPLARVREQLALRRSLLATGFDSVIDLQNSDRTRLYRWFFLRNIPWSTDTGKVPAMESDSERYRCQLEAAGVPIQHTLMPDVSWMAEDVNDILAEAQVKKPYIALIPGCSARHLHKRWPHYPQLAEALLAQGYDVVTAPGPDELELAKSIPGHVLRGSSGYLNWFQLAGMLKQANFVIGNDTGPSHVASALGTAGIALFGSSTTPGRTGILRPRFGAIAVADLTQLSVAEVLAVVLERIALQEQPTP